MFRHFIIIILLFITSITFAQSKKTLEALRTTQHITIDGALNENQWEKAQVANDFFQIEPNSGDPSQYKSEVKVIYSDYALYIGAKLFDPNPESIMRQLGKRDEIGQTDFFGISIDPFNDGLNGYTFIVTSSNIQFDARQSVWEDESWDAVWVSAAEITSDGWIVEMEIPYSALRFPKKEIQTWGVNFVRNVQTTREKSFWNNVDPKINGFLKQAGVLHGVKDVEPPIRLSVTPYLSGYLNKNSESSGFSRSIKGGLDLKYGLNESYTLDMMLIPDFGQVESDDEVLNISPFETYYQEKRPFFTEGTELFNKGDIFYSRRIGSTPHGYNSVATDSFEIVDDNPSETQLINVTKISGRGKNGLGIGFLNGMSQRTMAIIKDTITGETRKAETQPFTNYNVFVFDQSLKNNSYVSLTNTNYYQTGSSYMANVTASEFRLENKKGTYAFAGILGSSYINDQNISDSIGYKYHVAVEKIKGNFRWELEQFLANNKFNPNDMGFLHKTNELHTELDVDFNIYKPFGIFLNMYNNLEFVQRTYFSERENISNHLFFRNSSTFRNYLSLGFWSNISLGDINDFYEARTPGRVFIKPGAVSIGGYLSPDYRKPFVVDINGNYTNYYRPHQYSYSITVSPIARVSDHFNFRIRSNFYNAINELGYAGKISDTDSIFIGQRNVNILTNSINANYVFNSKSALSLKLRHYWSSVNYDSTSYFLLNNDGTIDRNNSYSTNDENANFFNIDLVYTWRFAPGSELSLVWKQAIIDERNEVIGNYFDNIDNLFGVAQNNSISFRLVYYLDYLQLKKRF